MQLLFTVLKHIIGGIAALVFIAGLVFTGLGIYDFVHAFSEFWHKSGADMVGAVAVGLLQGVDLFLIAIVLFVFSLGINILFTDKPAKVEQLNLPAWLRIHSFMQLKIILWEAILTTLVVSYLAGLSQLKIQGRHLDAYSLILPGAVLLIALSLFFLKKGEK
jgi:uncharacterized membrane protein YqhA